MLPPAGPNRLIVARPPGWDGEPGVGGSRRGPFPGGPKASSFLGAGGQPPRPPLRPSPSQQAPIN